MRTRRPGRSTAEVGWVVKVAAFEAALQRMTERGGRILSAPDPGDGVLYRGRVAP